MDHFVIVYVNNRDAESCSYGLCVFIGNNIVDSTNFLRKHKELKSSLFTIYYPLYKVTNKPRGDFLKFVGDRKECSSPY